MAEYLVPDSYATIQLALSAIPSDLTGTGVNEVVVSAGIRAGFGVSGFTNASSSDYVVVRAKAGDEHKGVFGVGVRVQGKVSITNVNYTIIKDISIEENYFICYGGSNIEIENVLNKRNTSYAIFQTYPVSGNISITFKKCVGVETNTTGSSQRAFGMLTSTYSTTAYFYNCVGISKGSGTDNNGFRKEYGTAHLVNCIFYVEHLTGSECIYGTTSTKTKVVTNDLTGSSGYKAWTIGNIGFKDYSNNDFHITAASDCNSVGDDIVSVTTDIDGNALVSGSYPIGINIVTNLFYVYLGDGTTRIEDDSPGSGDGTIASPFSAGKFYARAKSGGTGTCDDNYKIYGAVYSDAHININLFLSIYGWSVPINGPWRIKTTDTDTNTKFGYDSAMNSIITDAIIDLPNSDNVDLYASTIINSHITGNSAKSLIVKAATTTFLGSTINRKISSFSSNQDIVANDTIFHQDFIETSGSLDTLTSTNSVFKSSETSLNTIFNTLTDTGCQFDFLASIDIPGYSGEMEDFVVDENITINAAGPFTTYPITLFGNRRSKWNYENKGASIGATYQRSTYFVDKNGSGEFLNINHAISMLGTNLGQTRGPHDIIIKEGTYAAFTLNLSNTTATNYVKIRAINGDEHKGNWDVGVHITSGGSIYINTAYTVIKDIGILVNLTDATGVVSGKLADNSIFENIIVKVVRNASYAFENDNNVNNYNVKFYKCLVWLIADKTLISGIRTGPRGCCYNCVIISDGTCSAGFNGKDGSSSDAAYNCISIGSTAPYLEITGDYNVSSNSSAPGAHSLVNKTIDQLGFKSTTLGNFHIKSDSILAGVGVDESSLFTTDIDGELITSWPIGMDIPVTKTTTYTVGEDKTYTTITDAISAIPDRLDSTGIHEVVIDAGSYDSEEIVIESTKYGGNFYNSDLDDKILIRAAAGSEHHGIFYGGVNITGGYISIRLDYTKIKDIAILNTLGNVFSVKGAISDKVTNVILENCLSFTSGSGSCFYFDYVDACEALKCIAYCYTV